MYLCVPSKEVGLPFYIRYMRDRESAHADLAIPATNQSRRPSFKPFLRQTTPISRTSPPSPFGAGQLRREGLGGLTKGRACIPARQRATLFVQPIRHTDARRTGS